MSARALYERFRGAVARRVLRTGIRLGGRWLTAPGNLNIDIPAELAIVGRVKALEYDCVRDGEVIEARHPFAPGARPVFAVGSGRGQLFMLGERSRFTDRGIIDYNAQGQAVDYHETWACPHCHHALKPESLVRKSGKTALLK